MPRNFHHQFSKNSHKKFFCKQGILLYLALDDPVVNLLRQRGGNCFDEMIEQNPVHKVSQHQCPHDIQSLDCSQKIKNSIEISKLSFFRIFFMFCFDEFFFFFGTFAQHCCCDM